MKMEINDSENSLLLNFSLSPLTFKPFAFKAGHPKNFSKQSMCYINNKDFILMSKHAKTEELMICQLTLKSNETGSIIGFSNYQEFSFRFSDDLRTYKQIKIGKMGSGSHLLSQYMKVEQRKDQDNFFIKYNLFEKKWIGCWGCPKKNCYLKIQQVMIFLARQRKLGFVRSEDQRFFQFKWCLLPQKNYQKIGQKGIEFPQTHKKMHKNEIFLFKE